MLLENITFNDSINNLTNITIISADKLDFASGLLPSGVYQQGFEKICYLNQVNILNSMQKLPIGVFIFISLALFGLLFHLYVVPFLRGKAQEYLESFGVWFSLGCVGWAFLLSFALTFKISYQGWKLLEMGAFALALLAGGFFVWKNRDWLKGFLKNLGGGLE